MVNIMVRRNWQARHWGQGEQVVEVKMTKTRAALALPCVALMVGGYIGLAALCHLQEVYAGLVFSLLWGAIYRADFAELAPAFLGSLCGIALAYAYQRAPILVAMGLILAAVYCLLLGWLPLLINNGAMLFLTIGTIPEIQAHASFPQAALAVTLAAFYFGGLLALLSLARRSAPAPRPH
jgi:hypothetical protein